MVNKSALYCFLCVNKNKNKHGLKGSAVPKLLHGYAVVAVGRTPRSALGSPRTLARWAAEVGIVLPWEWLQCSPPFTFGTFSLSIKFPVVALVRRWR